MSKKIVHLSDTSHPFTTVTDDSYRTLTSAEFAAIRAFQSNWGFVGNHDIGDDLVDMLADTATDPNTLISRFMRKHDLTPERDYTGIQTDLENLFILRATVTNPETVTFTSDEVEALESLPGEKSDSTDNPDKNLRKELFQEEADKRVIRYFIGQTGWAWFVHFIVDMPEFYDTADNESKALYEAKDGMTTLHMTDLFMSEGQAWDAINDDIRFNTLINDGTLTHVVELDKM